MYEDPGTNGTVWLDNRIKGKELDGVRVILRIADVGSDQDPTRAQDTIVLGEDVITVHQQATHRGEVVLDKETVYDLTVDDDRTARGLALVAEYVKQVEHGNTVLDAEHERKMAEWQQAKAAQGTAPSRKISPKDLERIQRYEKQLAMPGWLRRVMNAVDTWASGGR